MSEWRLLLETSSRIGQVGLAYGSEIRQFRRLDQQRRHCRDLTEMIRQILASESVGFSQLQAIVVSIGPGGYTGLRVGLTTAKVLSYATDVPLIAVPTFQAIVTQTPIQAERIWVIADALQGMIYLQRFKKHKPIDDLRIVSASDWLPWANREIWLTGPGVAIHSAALPCDVCLVEPIESREIQLAGLLQASQLFQPVTRPELMNLEPLYLRGSSAEEKAKSNTP